MFRTLICPKHVEQLISEIKIISDIKLVFNSSTKKTLRLKKYFLFFQVILRITSHVLSEMLCDFPRPIQTNTKTNLK